MNIVITGVPGTGKTTVSRELASKLNLQVYELNDYAKDYKIAVVKELQTFDFDLDKLFEDLESYLSDKVGFVVESHFAHYFSPDRIDFLVVLNRDLKLLRREYESRGYNKEKIRENLEAEAFNVCFYEALELGFDESRVVLVDNNLDLKSVVDQILKNIE